jgi:hypothetical protein
MGAAFWKKGNSCRVVFVQISIRCVPCVPFALFIILFCDFPTLQQFIDIARIRQEHQTAVKMSSSLAKCTKELQVVTQQDVTSVISDLIKLVEEVKTNQFVVRKF